MIVKVEIPFEAVEREFLLRGCLRLLKEELAELDRKLAFYKQKLAEQQKLEAPKDEYPHLSEAAKLVRGK